MGNHHSYSHVLMECGGTILLVAVGMPVTRHLPHRSRGAELPHRALASGSNAQALCKVLSPCAPPLVPGQVPVAGYPGTASGPCYTLPDSPWPVP